MSTTNIAYQGKVTVSLKRQGHPEQVYHLKNSGQSYLFQQLCLAVLGLPYQTPNYIDAGITTVTEASETFTSKLTYRSPIVRRTVVTGTSTTATNYSARMVATIVYDQLLSPKEPLSTLALYGDANGSLSHMASLSLGSGVKLEQGDALAISWEMTFQNGAEEQGSSSPIET